MSEQPTKNGAPAAEETNKKGKKAKNKVKVRTTSLNFSLFWSDSFREKSRFNTLRRAVTGTKNRNSKNFLITFYLQLFQYFLERVSQSRKNKQL